MTAEDALVCAGGMRLAIGHASRPCSKPMCEDFFDMACPSSEELSARGRVFALADGVSGGGGRLAAETCVRTVLSDFYDAPLAWEVARRLDCIIGALNAWLAAHNARAASPPECMLSTLSVLVLHEAQCFVAHVGDCRVYRVRGSSFERFTTDHLWPRADMRNVLRRALGLDHHLVVDSCTHPVAAGDRFVMLSDGVWEVLGEAGLADALVTPCEPQQLADVLVERSIERQRSYYGRNDATAAVIDVAAA